MDKVEDAVQIYRDLAKIPCLSLGRFSKAPPKAGLIRSVYSEWSQRDLERNEKVKFARQQTLAKTERGLEVLLDSDPIDVSKEIYSKEAPSGKFRGVVRSVKDKDGKDKQYIEIWNKSQKLTNIDVDAQEKHGKIYENDATFGCFEWSASEGHLLYVAEKKQPKTASYFDNKPKKLKDEQAEDSKGKDSEEAIKGDQFVYKDEWGELLVGKHHPVLCVLNVDTGDISVLENIPDNVSPGQAVWAPDDAGIVFVGVEHNPYRLGIIYCPIRKSAIYYLDLQTATCVAISTMDAAVRSPRFSPDMSKLICLKNKAGGPHRQCSTLEMYNWLEKQTKTVVNIVDTINGDEFPGLYSLLLPERCWSDDNIRVVIDTEWRSKCEAVVINTDTSEVIRLTKDDDIGNWHVLDVVDDYVLAQCSSPNQPHFLMVGELPEVNKEQEIKWSRLGEAAALEDITWKILKHNRSPDGDVTKEFESVLISPKTDSSKKPPLVVYPHGGPHSVFSSEYSLYAAALCNCGFAVLFVNYGGSTGFGQASIEALPGNIGTADVSDVQFAAECVVNSAFKLVHKRRVFLAGGSHGGFLTAHLIGQYPDFYRAAVLRNPVVNIASMMHTTDIPDWCCVEAGLGFDFKTICDPAGYQALWKHSPIRYADQMKTPSVIMLGANDLRVPPSQGKELYKALHSRGVTVRLLIYPDNSHPLNKVDTEADAFMNIVKWFWDHLHKEVPEETI